MSSIKATQISRLDIIVPFRNHTLGNYCTQVKKKKRTRVFFWVVVMNWNTQDTTILFSVTSARIWHAMLGVPASQYACSHNWCNKIKLPNEISRKPTLRNTIVLLQRDRSNTEWYKTVASQRFCSIANQELTILNLSVACRLNPEGNKEEIVDTNNEQRGVPTGQEWVRRTRGFFFSIFFPYLVAPHGAGDT